MSQLTIATRMYCEPPGEESYYPQVGGLSSSNAFQATYWRCIALLFASSVRHNPLAKHQLFTNAGILPVVDDLDMGVFLKELNVEVVNLPISYLPPQGYFDAWRSVFYILDALKYTAERAEAGQNFLFTDMDCLFVAPATSISRAIDDNGLLLYDPGFSPDEDTNGITRRDMAAIYQELGTACLNSLPISYGAEIIAASGEVIQKIAPEIDPLWQACLERFAAGKAKFNTEEHFLSYIYYKLGYYGGTANPFIARIWTGRKKKTAQESDFALTIWHVPAEKKYGLRRLFNDMRQPNSRFWDVEPGVEFAKYAAGYLGIPQNSRVKRTQDTLDALLWRIQGHLARGQNKPQPNASATSASSLQGKSAGE